MNGKRNYYFLLYYLLTGYYYSNYYYLTLNINIFLNLSNMVKLIQVLNST